MPTYSCLRIYTLISTYTESPDELALVQGMDIFESRLIERGTVKMNVDILGALIGVVLYIWVYLEKI